MVKVNGDWKIDVRAQATTFSPVSRAEPGRRPCSRNTVAGRRHGHPAATPPVAGVGCPGWVPTGKAMIVFGIPPQGNERSESGRRHPCPDTGYGRHEPSSLDPWHPVSVPKVGRRLGRPDTMLVNGGIAGTFTALGVTASAPVLPSGTCQRVLCSG